MAERKKQTVLGTLVTILIIAALLWARYDEVRDEQARDGELRDEQVTIPIPSAEKSTGGSRGESTERSAGSERDSETSTGSSVVKSDVAASPKLRAVNISSTRYQVWRKCTLIEHRGNDGDSFHIRAPHGQEEVRLYYVDAPESAARSYGNGDTNHKRIAQQGAALGGLDQHETTQVGVAAKAFVKKLLKGKQFTVVTSGERVYNSHRKYAFVIVDWQGQPRYLHELLVAYGLGRIHTKPMTLPDNTAGSRQKKHLYELQQFAKEHQYGAWGVRGG